MHDDLITNYRSLFPITHNTVFLDNAAMSCISSRTHDAIAGYLACYQHVSHETSATLFADVMGKLRSQIATYINATPETVAIMPNTATALNTVAVSLPLQPGDNVLLIDGDYPANIYPWMNLAYRGILTKMVPAPRGGVDVALLEQRIDARTRVIAVSTVMFSSGYRNDIAAIGALCRQHAITFVVDGIQSLGAFPLDVQANNIDFLAAGSQKWLLSVPGCGFLYCRQSAFEQLVPGAYVGAASVVDPYNFLDYNLTYPQEPKRFHIGTGNMLGMVGLAESLAMLNAIGSERIGERIAFLVDTLMSILTERGYTVALAQEDRTYRSGIVVVKADTAEVVAQQMCVNGVVVSARGIGIRMSPHFYCTVDDLHRACDVFDDVQAHMAR